MVGLTATPAGFIGRDTFLTFGCHNQTPTFLYTYQTAVDEKRLVDFRLYQVQTGLPLLRPPSEWREDRIPDHRFLAERFR